MPEKLTKTANYKTSAARDEQLRQDCAALDCEKSEIVRLALEFAVPAFLECPSLLKLNRQDREELGSYLGSTLVVQPLKITPPPTKR